MRVENSKVILCSMLWKGRDLDPLDGMLCKIEDSDPSRLENLLHFNGTIDSPKISLTAAEQKFLISFVGDTLYAHYFFYSRNEIILYLIQD